MPRRAQSTKRASDICAPLNSNATPMTSRPCGIEPKHNYFIENEYSNWRPQDAHGRENKKNGWVNARPRASTRKTDRTSTVQQIGLIVRIRNPNAEKVCAGMATKQTCTLLQEEVHMGWQS